MKARRASVLAAAALLFVPVAHGGHELPVYPSYYPHEIEIKTIAPEAAPDLLRTGALHAYAGLAANSALASSRDIQAAESLGALAIVRLNRNSPFAGDDATACAAVSAVVRTLAARAHGIFTVHPYPVTPWHGDYLDHIDRAEAARDQILHGDAQSHSAIKVLARGAWAGLVPSEWRAADSWDAAIEEVDVATLVADATVALNGWLGPRWVRSGWFHAYRVLRDAVHDPAQKQSVEASVGRLKAAEYRDHVERINVERELVRSLTAGCRALVAGYTVKRELFNVEFSAGIENVSFDALEGLGSPMFLRTAKLKDFPWNGSLRLATDGTPNSAWNPVGGFTDRFGRLAWYAIADPAAVPSPYGAGWILNRISDVQVSPRK